MKNSHCTIRNESFFCYNCGGKQIIPFPIDTRIFGAMAKEFEKIHKNCEPIWKQPEPDMSLSKSERIRWWLENGERGVSSNTIIGVITDCFIDQKHYGHPHDPDDFRRCYELLKAVPELKMDLYKMKSLSEVWSKLVDNWDRLTQMLEEKIKSGKPNGMYELMQSLGC
jgi:hypothetical protein